MINEDGEEEARHYLRHAREDFVANRAKGKEGQVMRVTSRFGVVEAALKYARYLGVFGGKDKKEIISNKEIEWAVKTMYDAWIEDRRTDMDKESSQITKHVLGVLEENFESKFAGYKDVEDKRIPTSAGEHEIETCTLFYPRRSLITSVEASNENR